MARQVQKEVAQLISRGCVLMVHKTKPKTDGGRQLVSVGPYRTATGSGRRYTVITKLQQGEYLSAVTAAKEFVSFVGRARAAEALARPRCSR